MIKIKKILISTIVVLNLNTILCANEEKVSAEITEKLLIFIEGTTQNTTWSYDYKFNLTDAGLKFFKANSFARAHKLKHKPSSWDLEDEYKNNFGKLVKGSIQYSKNKFKVIEEQIGQKKNSLSTFKFDGLRHMTEKNDDKKGYILEYSTLRTPTPIESLLYVPDKFSHVSGTLSSGKNLISDWLLSSSGLSITLNEKGNTLIRALKKADPTGKIDRMLTIEMKSDTFEPMRYSYGRVDLDSNKQIIKEYKTNDLLFLDYKENDGFKYPSLIVKRSKGSIDNALNGLTPDKKKEILDEINYQGDVNFRDITSEARIEINSVIKDENMLPSEIFSPRKIKNDYFYYDYNLDGIVQF